MIQHKCVTVPNFESDIDHDDICLWIPLYGSPKSDYPCRL